jgi:transposase InsO family protein
MRDQVIQEYDRRSPIRRMCRALAVSPAGYSAWRARPESPRAVANRDLLTAIRQVHHDSRQTYGSPRIGQALREQGHWVGEHRVARLMRHDGLRAKTAKHWQATTHSSHGLPVVANTLQRQFTVAQPTRVCGPVLACRHRLGDGPSLDRRYHRTGPPHGAQNPAAPSRTPASLRPRESIGRRALSADAYRARYHGQHEPQRQLLG